MSSKHFATPPAWALWALAAASVGMCALAMCGACPHLESTL